MAIALGTFMEGETAAIVGGVMASYGLFPLWLAALAAFGGAFIADFGIFLFARRYRDHPWVARQLARPALAGPMARVNRNPYPLACIYRFIPGMRIIGPIVLAHSVIPSLRFAVICATASGVWATAYTVFGVAIGGFISRMLTNLSGATHLIVAGLAVLGLVGLAGFIFTKRRRSVTSSVPVEHD